MSRANQENGGHFCKHQVLVPNQFCTFWTNTSLHPVCFVIEGLPYIPRVHLSEGSLVRSPLKWLWSEEPMVRRSFIPKFLYSESCYVPKILYSERPSTIWILCYEDSLVRSSSSPKGAMFRTSIFRKSPLPHTDSILSSTSSKIAMFRTFYLPNFARSIRILCYEVSSWWYLNFSGRKILQAPDCCPLNQ